MKKPLSFMTALKKTIEYGFLGLLLLGIYGFGSGQALALTGGYLLGSASPNPADSSVTISVSGGLPVGRTMCERTSGPGYQYVSSLTDQTTPANTATIVSGPSGFAGQTIGLSISQGSLGVCSEDAETLGFHSTFSGTSNAISTASLANGTYTARVSVTPEGGVAMTKDISFTVDHPASAPTVSLSASPSSVSSGQTTTLSWTSTNATSCTATGGTGFSTGGATGGSDASGSLTSQTTFSISCTGAGGTATDSVTVDVSAAPTSPTCSVSPSSADVGATVTATAAGGTSGSYTWSTGGGSACSAGTTCATSYSTTGSKTITVTRNGLSGTCAVSIASGPGVCGSANGATYATAPTTNLCDVGTASAVSGGSSWTWTCAGTGGATASCSASVLGAPVVVCSGSSAGQTGTSYTFTGSGGSTYTWAVSPTTDLSPAGSSGSGSSVTKSFSTAGTKTITFTSGSSSGQCAITITTTPPPLAFDLSVNGWDTPPVIAYGTMPTISWTSSGADRVDDQGASPVDTDWPGTSGIGAAGSKTISPLVRTIYSGRGVDLTSGTQVADTVTVRVQPQCLPAGQTVSVGQTASLTAAGGNGTYAWTATGGTPASGSGSSLSVSYASTGTKTVSLASDSLTTNCTVTVSAAPAATGTVVVNSVNAQGEPFLSTWSLSGPPGGSQTQGASASTATYPNSPEGLYTLTAGNVDGYTAVITPGASQNLVAGGTKTFTITYTENTPTGDAWVDLRANPTAITSGDSSTLSWTSSGIETGTCVATGDWSKSKDDSGSESTGALSAGATYTITCTKAQVSKGDPETVSDTASVTIIVVGDDDDNAPQCSDGEDNDGDGYIDYGKDPECLDAEDNLEAALPPPPGDDDDVIGACNDGFDNDGDGYIDQLDSGCNNGDDTEQSEPDVREI